MNFNLLNGDCLIEMTKLDDNSIDVIYCDLPFQQTKCLWDKLIDLDKFWIEIIRIKKLHTPIIMSCNTKFGISLINSAPKRCPYRYDIIHLQSSSSGFLRSGKQPLRKHQLIYFFYEREPYYDISSHNKVLIRTTSQPKYSPPLPHSLLEIKSTRGKHSTEKPVGLMEWILKYYSKIGDIVLDPTMGSGSMGIACKNMNRRFIGIEMNKEIFSIATNRIQDKN